MDLLLERIEALRAFQERIPEIIRDEVLENQQVIIDMNANDQLYDQGITRDGVHIADYAPYVPETIKIKQKKGQPTNRVTLHDEGDFEGSFYVEADAEQFEIKASDFKTEGLKMKYGDEILGLTDESATIFTQQYLKQRLLTEANNII